MYFWCSLLQDNHFITRVHTCDLETRVRAAVPVPAEQRSRHTCLVLAARPVVTVRLDLRCVLIL